MAKTRDLEGRHGHGWGHELSFRRRAIAVAAVLAASVIVTNCVSRAPAPFEPVSDQPSWLAPIPEIPFDSEAFLPSAAETAEIRGLIEALDEIDSPDFGLSATLMGTAFAPIGSSGRFQGGVISVDHGLETSDAFQRLVALGPKALPALLESIDDDTPTKLIMERTFPIGVVWYGREVPVNPLNEREARVQSANAGVFASPENGDLSNRSISRHVITRGDICFVILGQILNRSYLASRYQPSGSQVINSPTHDDELARVVREMWESDDAPRTLFDSLLTDFHTRGESLQCGAAMRLLFYFPEHVEDLVARRIDALDVRRREPDAWRERYEVNRVSAEEFLRSVKAIDREAITRSLIGVLRRTDDPELFDAALGAAVVEQVPELVYERLRKRAMVATPEGEIIFHHGGDGFAALVQAAMHFPERSAELFAIHAGHRNLDSVWATIHAMGRAGISTPWAKEHLGALLDDTRATSWHYGPEYDRRPLRICDDAARVLSRLVPGISFETKGSHADLDRRIARIKRYLSGDRTVVFAEPKLLPADLPRRDAVRVLDFDDDLSRVYRFSTETTLWVGHGFRVDGGWSRETLEIDVESGEVRKRTPLDTWHGAVSVLRPTTGRRAFCYHGDRGGIIFVRDLITGRVLETLRSPFHDLREGDDALLVRNFSDIAVSGDGNWILAFTPDGTLHSINTKTGAYTVEWRYPEAVGREFTGSRDLLALRDTNRFLLEHDSDEDPVLRIWDQDSRTMTEVEGVPFRGWKGGRGDVAWQSVNREPTVWDLRRREELELPGGTSGAIRFELSREARILFMMRRDGTVIVYRLATRTPIARLTPPVERSEKDEGWFRLDMTLSADDALLFWQYDRSRGDDERTTIAIFDVADL